MSVKQTKNSVPVYAAPDCDACNFLSSAIICQSADVEDWTIDEEGSF